MKSVIDNNSDPIVLSDEPLQALKEIGGYLSSINYSVHHKVTEDDDGEQVLLGYWQTPEYLQGCVDIVNECNRITENHTNSSDDKGFEDGQVKTVQYSIDGFRRHLSNDIKELSEIIKDVIDDEYYDKEDLVDKLNDIICSSNSFNCVSMKGCEMFSDLSDIELPILECEDQ